MDDSNIKPTIDWEKVRETVPLPYESEYEKTQRALTEIRTELHRLSIKHDQLMILMSNLIDALVVETIGGG